MKKIAVFSNMYPSISHPTFGIFVKNQVDLLKQAEVQVDVIANDNPRRGKLTTISKYSSWFLRALFYLQKNHKQLAATHAHYVFPTGVLSLLAKKRYGIPYIVTVHGGDIDKMSQKSTRIFEKTKEILQQADRVIVVGERLKENVLQEFQVESNRVIVMSMGVDRTIFKVRPKSTMREELLIPLEDEVILFVGNVIEAKGVQELIEAFALLKEKQAARSLYIVGAERDDRFSTQLRQIIEQAQLTDVHFIEPKQQSELAKWMSAADVLALPSYHEGFGLVALEAMAANTPVVGSDVGGLTSLLQDDAGILVPPKDVLALAQGLEQALQEENGLNEASIEDRVAYHSFERIVEQLVEQYQEISNEATLHE